MLAVRTILHPTDFSDRSQYAFWLACALARDYHARLVLLHVVDVPMVIYGDGGAVMPPNPEELRAGARDQLDALQVPHVDIRAERRLEEGDAVETILRVAHEIQADLIVMGNHGRTGLGRLLMGSVAERVVRQATCPVLTVRSPFPETAPESELAAAAVAPA
jgi:nucleotide-binding universal stress UspA family protein